MTPEELDRWAAELCGVPLIEICHDSENCKYYGYIRKDRGDPWSPSDPATGQIWLVIDKMAEEEWHLKLFDCCFPSPKRWEASFSRMLSGIVTEYGNNPCLAILRAAAAALPQKE